MAETKKQKKAGAEIAKAIASRLSVRIERHKIETANEWIDGFILAASPDLVLIANIDNSIHLDGYVVLRKSDVSVVHAPHVRHYFFRDTLRLRGERAKMPRIRIDDMQAVLQSAQRLFPLVTIHREFVDPDICKIGRVVKLTERSFDLDRIDIHAKFDGEFEAIHYADVTRVDFGGGYENALALVAGLMKPSKSARPNSRRS